MKSIEKSNFNPDQTRRLAKKARSLLTQISHRYGDAGKAFGVLSVSGRGDGSLEDSYREATPEDDFSDYHDEFNSLQPSFGPFFVHTRPSRPEMTVLIVPHLTGINQPGSSDATWEREEMIGLTAELLTLIVSELGHHPGLIVNQDVNQIQVLPPGQPEAMILEAHRQSRNIVADNFAKSLKRAVQLRPEAVVVISDFIDLESQSWRAISRLGRNSKLIAVQIVDPWDRQLPDVNRHQGWFLRWLFGVRRIRIRQEDELFIVKSSNSAVRTRYEELAQEYQVGIEAGLKRARWHCQLFTDRDLENQLEAILVDPRLIQKVRAGY